MSSPFQPSPSLPPVPPVPPAYQPGNPHQTAMVLAVLSVCLGAAGFLSNCGCFGCVFMPLPPLAIIMGIIALTQNPDSTGKPLAIAGIACGGLSILLWFLMLALGVGGAILNNTEFQR